MTATTSSNNNDLPTPLKHCEPTNKNEIMALESSGNCIHMLEDSRIEPGTKLVRFQVRGLHKRPPSPLTMIDNPSNKDAPSVVCDESRSAGPRFETCDESDLNSQDCVLPGKSLLKRSRYASKGNSIPPATPTGIRASDISALDVIVGDADVGVLDLPNSGNRRLLLMAKSKIRTFSKLKTKDRLRMAQATANLVQCVGGRFLTVNVKTGLLEEVKLQSAWRNIYMTYRTILLEWKRALSIRRLHRAIQQQEIEDEVQSC